MVNETRKLSVLEIQRQQDYLPLVEDMQKSFEHIQEESVARGAAASFTVKINVIPPQDNDRFGEIRYEIKETLPPKKSSKYTTEVQNGFIVTTAKDPISIDQLALQLHETKLHKINGGK
jgi:hypothetical protein